MSTKNNSLNLDMTRGKPSKEQLDLSLPMLDILNSKSSFLDENDFDVRNYGELTGIPEARKLLGDVLGMDKDNIIVYGNSSLQIMYDQISRSFTHGVCGNPPFMKQGKIKWICPVPGYDRHFAICEHFGIEMINVEMDDDGPDMDRVEELVKDPAVKGMWIVPKFSNPSGICFSDEVIKRLAALKPEAKDFRIYVDNAYVLHGFKDKEILNIYQEAKKIGNEDIIYMFTSTSKISFPGAGISCLGASSTNIEDIKKQLSNQIISYDKINQLRHVRFFKDVNGLKEHLKKHKQILKPKFDIVCFYLDQVSSLIEYEKPSGGYFITIRTNGIAKEVVKECASRGVKLTAAGATHPYHKDSSNSYIRLAPSYLSESDLELAMQVLIQVIKELS